MIQHVSVTADQPREAAGTIAALLGGRAVPIGPVEGTWTAIGPELVGNIVEVLPRGSEFHRNGSHVETRAGEAVRHSGFHVMIESPLAEEDVMQLAEEHGACACRAKHGPFDLLEFWIDDCLLIEVLPPNFASAYRRILTSGELRERYAGRLGLDA